MEIKSNISRYENIAFLIANQIYDGSIPLHSKLSGRTLLSSEYKVSSETIRRAIHSLVNYGVVEVKEQIGVYAISKTQAKVFIDDFLLKQKQKNIKVDLLELIEEEKNIRHKKEKMMKKLLESEAFFPFDYFTVEITGDMKNIGKTIENLNFHQATGGLIIAYEYNHMLYQIPKPTTTIEKNMVLYIMGDLTIKKNVLSLFV